jgi:transposase
MGEICFAVGMKSLSKSQLQVLAAKLLAENTQLKAEVLSLETKVGQLTAQVEQLQAEVARSAAPFRRRPEKKIPQDQHKKPGNKKGHPGTHRPIPEVIDESIDVPLSGCPNCQGELWGVEAHVQYVEEIPPTLPKTVKITTYVGQCVCCGEVRSTHPLQSGRGFGASAVHLGPRALACLVLLNKQFGVTMRKTCRILNALWGLKLSPGGLSQALDRISDRVKSDYQKLFRNVRAGPAVYVDETSWWVGGPGYWLHTFANPKTTLYRVEKSRGSEVVNKTMKSYSGVVITDCLNIYDAKMEAKRRHKCIAHHLKAIKQALETPGLKDRTYLEAWKALWQKVCAVMPTAKKWSRTQVEQYHQEISDEVDGLLNQRLWQKADKKIHFRLAKQREHLLTCLKYPKQVEATNNRAERALRPAVIARKLSCGNKTIPGKTTWERLTSLVTTYEQRGLDTLECFTQHSQLYKA